MCFETGKRGHGLDELSLDFLSHETIKYNEITTVDKKKIPFNEVDIKLATQYAAEDSDITLRLWEKLRIELIKNNLFDFYHFIEKPLVNVIASMEKNGFKINEHQLENLSIQFSDKLKNIEKKYMIYQKKSSMLVHLSNWVKSYLKNFIYLMVRKVKVEITKQM